MANVKEEFGLRPYRKLDGTPLVGAQNRYTIASNMSHAIFQGDLVIVTTAGNIEKYNKLKALPKFNLIIDCCAEPAIEASRKEPNRVFNTNLIGTFNILKKCITDNANIIFLSSSRV